MACSTDLAPADRENLDVVQTSTNDLTRIINSVLDYNRLEAGAIDIESIEFDLRDVIENAAATVGHIAQAKKLEVLVESTIDSDPRHVLLGDPHRLRQALLNILGNAIKFTPALGTGDKKSPVIKIRWTLEDKGNNMEICIACEDSGIGINRKALGKIFSPFTQADAGISRRFEGSGLGLSITRGLCRAMGGDCWVESVEGVGSTFYCLIVVKKNGPIKGDKWALPAAKHKRGVFYTSNSVCAAPVSSHLRLFGVDMAATESFDAEPDPKNQVDIAIVDAGITQKSQVCDLAKRIREVHKGVSLVIMVDPAHVETYSKDPELDGISLIIKPVKASALYRLVKQYDEVDNGAVPIAGGRNVPRDSSGRRIQAMDPRTAIDYPLRLLYVDDNLVNIKVGKKILEKFGYKNVDTALDGRDAAEMAAKTKYDLIFMDLQMPVMDGYASQAAIKADTRAGDPCIVALTANCDNATQRRCAEAGFYGFLSKPIVFPKLAALLPEVYQYRQHPSNVPHNVNNAGTKVD